MHWTYDTLDCPPEANTLQHECVWCHDNVYSGDYTMPLSLVMNYSEHTNIHENCVREFVLNCIANFNHIQLENWFENYMSNMLINVSVNNIESFRIIARRYVDKLTDKELNKLMDVTVVYE